MRSPHALTFVLLTVLIDTIGLGIVIPVLPELVMHLTGEGLSAASRWGGWLAFAYASMQVVFAPVIGGLSDRYGRRPVLLASLTAFGLDYLLMGWAPTLGWLFLGRMVAGMTGASYVTANAYVADVTTPDQRSQSFGLVGAMFGIGFIVGPALGGFLGALGIRAPFFAAAGLALVNVMYGAVVLPESLPREHRRPFSLRGSNPFAAIRHLRRMPAVLGLAIAFFAWQLAHQVLPSTWSYYTMFRFQWSEQAVGLSLAAVGVSMIIVQGGLTRVLIPRMGQVRAALMGLGLGGLGYLGYGLATQGWMMYAWMAVGALGGLVYPSLNGMISTLVPPNEQGALQGALSSLAGLSAVLGPPFMTQLFGYFTSERAPILLPGASFLAASLLAWTALGLVRRARGRAAAG